MSTTTAIERDAATRVRLRIPNHLGVIMDGNGRWALSRGRPRTDGHLAGVRAVRQLVRLAIDYGIPYVTVFGFSSENWRRPPDEVNFIFGLLRRFVASDLETLIRNNVQVRIIGSREGLDPSLLRLIEDTERKTAANPGLVLVIAFNYGGKAEIANAVRRIAGAVARGEIAPEAINEETVAAALYTAGLPDPDLIIRTSGEQRISNFLLWQGAYAELVFIRDNWPDFDERTFVAALEEFTARDRRFGAVEAQVS